MNNQKNILIVEDEIDVAELLSMVCEGQGYKTKIALNGFEAMKILEKIKPEIVFIDLIMEGMDGIELIKELNKQDYDGHVVISSGYHTSFVDMAIDFCTLRSIKSSRILSKPFTLEKVKECVNQIENFKGVISPKSGLELAAG